MKKRIGILSFLISAAVFAQGTTIELDKSVIKNQNRERDFIVVPKVSKNTFTVTQEEIRERSYKNVEDVLKDAPGVIVNNTAFGPKIDMRGSGDKSLSRVKVMVDGISINPTEEAMASLPINSIPIESVKKIEIIPGGGATLYGSGSVGGVINIVTNSNATKDNFFMDLKYGSFDNRNFGFAGGQNVTDKLYLNYGFNYINTEGYRESEDNQNTAFLGGFDYKINERNKIRFQARTNKDKKDGTTEVSKKILAENRKAPGLNMDIDTDNTSYTFDYELRATDNLSFGATYFEQMQKRKIKAESIDDIEIVVTTGNRAPVELTNLFKDVPSMLDATMKEEKKGVKLKSVYNYNENKGSLTVGYDYLHAVNTRKSRVESKVLVDYFESRDRGYHWRKMGLNATEQGPLINNIDIKLKKDSHSLYAFNKYELTDKLDITAGIRGEKTIYSGYRKNGPNKIPFTGVKTSNIDTDESMKNYAGEVGTLYKYNDTGSVYLRYERGFVTPFAAQLTDKIHDSELNRGKGQSKPPQVNVASVYVANNLKAETTDTLEIGFRDYILNSYVALSLYATDTENEITTINSGVTNPAVRRWKYRNIGKTRRMGIELEAEQEFDRLSFQQSLSLVSAKVINGSEKYGIVKGQKIPMVPNMKLTLGAKYNITDNWSVLSSYTYVGSQEARELDKNDKVVEYKIKGHGVIDAGLNYKIDSYANLKFGIKNLTSTKYNLRETSLEAYPAPERNYYLELNVKF